MPANSFTTPSTRPVYGFDPRSIGGCAIWLDGSDSTAFTFSSGTNISAWLDKSGYSNNAQVRAGTCTLTANAKNNLSGVTFGGSAILSNASTILSMSTHTFFIVAKESTHVDNAGFVSFLPSIPNSLNAAPQSNDFNTFVLASSSQSGDARGTGYMEYYGGYNSTYQVRDINCNNTASPTKTIPDFIYSGVFTGGSAQLYRNGNYLGSSVRRNAYGPLYQNNTGYLLGGRYINRTVSTGAILNGVIYEFLYFTTALQSYQRQMVEGYLAWKWGFQNASTKNLPVQHPGYLTPILARTFNPNDIDQCCVWFDAADATTITSNANRTISSWRSKGWSSFNVVTNVKTLSTGVVSINGLNTVRVNGASDLTVTNFGLLSNQARTIFHVIYSPSPGASDYYSLFSVQNTVATTNTGQQIFVAFNTKLKATIAQNFGSPVTGLVSTGDTSNITAGPLLTSIVHSDNLELNSNYIGFNGIQAPLAANYAANAYSTSATQYYLGNVYNNVYNLCEFIEYNQTLTVTQRQQVEGYLANKWGITLSYTGNWPAAPANPITTPLAVVSGGVTCRLWLDASDTANTAPATGGNITSWTDKSTTARTVTFVSTQNIRYDPTNKEVVLNGLKGVHFLANVDARDAIIPNLSIFICGRWPQVQSQFYGNAPYNNKAGVLWANAGSRLQYLTYPDANVEYYVNGGTSNIWWFTSNKDFVYSCHYSTPSQSASIYVNQNLFLSFNSPGTVGANTNLYFGDYDGLGNNNTAYAFKEIIVYSGPLTASSISQIHYYLGQKYGLTQTQFQSNNSFALYPPISGQAFSPVTIPSLVAWYDAMDPFFNSNVLPSENSTITNWIDKSGFSRNLRAFTAGTGAIRYVTQNTYPSIYLNGSGATNPALFSTINSTINGVDLTQYTHFNVCTGVTPVGNQVVFCALPETGSNTYNSLAGFGFYIDSDGNQRNRFYGSILTNIVTNANPTSGNAYPRALASYTETRTGALVSYINGSNGSTDSDAITRSFTAQGFGMGVDFIGATAVTAGLTIQTNVHEAIVYNTVLPNPERQRVEGYLAWKWGLNRSLPTTHPYFSFPPSPDLANAIPAFSTISTLVDTATYVPAATTMTSFFTGNTWNVPNQATVSSPTIGNNFFSLNGTNQYLVDSTGIQNTTAYSIDIWFNARSIQTANIVGEQGSTAPYTGYTWSQINLLNNGGIGQIYMTTYQLALPGTFMGTYAINQWTHVCMTSSGLNGATTILRGYVNGIFRGSNSGIRTAPTTCFFILGGPANPNNNYFSGQLGPFRFYRRVLTDDEIYANYKSQAPRFGIQI